jgi:hypothetical protein
MSYLRFPTMRREYAVVHLAWTGEFKPSDWLPRTQLFDSLDQWLVWMKADHDDYTHGVFQNGSR